MDNIEFYLADPKRTPADDQLLLLTQERKGILVTNDVSLKVRAIALGVETEGYSWDGDYTGIYYLKSTDVPQEVYYSILAELNESGKYECEDHTFSYNEYLVVPPYNEDASNGDTSIFKYNGTTFDRVHFKTIPTNWLLKGHEIKPRNIEQICLFDAILNSQNKILYVGGPFGTGKTFSTHHYAINQLETGKIKKIIYVPNNSYTQNTMDLGALPGDLIEKVQPIIGPLIDIVGID